MVYPSIYLVYFMWIFIKNKIKFETKKSPSLKRLVFRRRNKTWSGLDWMNEKRMDGWLYNVKRYILLLFHTLFKRKVFLLHFFSSFKRNVKRQLADSLFYVTGYSLFLLGLVHKNNLVFVGPIHICILSQANKLLSYLYRIELHCLVDHFWLCNSK